jgi:integrase
METSFKKGLIEKLENKDLSESSIKLYLRNLEKLNDDLPLKNFNFLKNQDEILKKLEEYKENTKRGYLISITATLSAVKDKYKNLYDKYYKLMIDFNNELKKKPTEEMTETQSENWLSWEDITTKFKELENKVNMFINNKEISENQYNILLSYMILSLYFYNPPRRNLDYQLMNIVKNYNESLPQDINYLDYDGNKFYFNVFKTAKKEGQVVVDIKPELKEIINKYLKFHPLLKHKKLSKTTNTPFLVYYNCKPFDKVNSITRILNKIFDKKIGSSMLRHIYLSNKYGDIQNQKNDDAKAMSHSVQTQNDYIKTKVV